MEQQISFLVLATGMVVGSALTLIASKVLSTTEAKQRPSALEEKKREVNRSLERSENESNLVVAKSPEREKNEDSSPSQIAQKVTQSDETVNQPQHNTAVESVGPITKDLPTEEPLITTTQPTTQPNNDSQTTTVTQLDPNQNPDTPPTEEKKDVVTEKVEEKIEIPAILKGGLFKRLRKPTIDDTTTTSTTPPAASTVTPNPALENTQPNPTENPEASSSYTTTTTDATTATTTESGEENPTIPDDVRAKLSALSAMRKRQAAATVTFQPVPDPEVKTSTQAASDDGSNKSKEDDEEAKEQAKIKQAASRGRRRSAMDQLMSNVEKVKKEKRVKKQKDSEEAAVPTLKRKESSLLSGIRSAAARSTQLGRKKLKRVKIHSTRSHKLILAKSRISGDEADRSLAIENFYAELESKREAIIKVSKENLVAERNLQSEMAKAKKSSPILKLAPKGALVEKERESQEDEEEIEKEWPAVERKEWNKIGEMDEEILLMESKKYDKARKSMLMDKQLTILITSVVRMENLVTTLQEDKNRLESLLSAANSPTMLGDYDEDSPSMYVNDDDSNIPADDSNITTDDSNISDESNIPPPPAIPFAPPPPVPSNAPPPPSGGGPPSDSSTETASQTKPQLKSVTLRAASNRTLKEKAGAGDPLSVRETMMKQIRQGGRLKKVDRETEREEIVEKKMTASEKLMDEIRKGAAKTLKRVDRRALDLEKERKRKEEEEKKRQMGEETLMDTLIAAMSVRKLTSFRDEDEEGEGEEDEDDEWDDDW